jgi:fatty acid desaturase
MPLIPEAQAERAPAEHWVEALDQALSAAPIATVRRSEVPAHLLGRPTINRLLRFAFEEWVMIAVLWGAMFFGPQWLYPVLALLVAGRLHALGVILHDAAHMPLRSKGPAIRLLEILAGYPIATTIDAMRYHHLRHHRDNGMPTDPYFKAGAEQSLGTRFLLRIRGVVLIPFWTVRTLVGLVAIMVPAVRQGYGRVFLHDRSGEDLRQSK